MTTITRDGPSKPAMAKAAERAALPSLDFRVFTALLSRADRWGNIPDRRQPPTMEALAKIVQHSTEGAAIGVRHLEKHGWVTRVKGALAGGKFTRFYVSIGTECDCPGRRRARVPLSDRERAKRCRARKAGIAVDNSRPVDLSGRTAVYRMFDRAGSLLYIGISNDFGRRWKQEASEKSWWPEVQKQEVEWYSTRDEALEVEEAAIKAEHPKYNIIHAAKSVQSAVGVGVDREADEALWTLYLESRALADDIAR